LGVTGGLSQLPLGSDIMLLIDILLSLLGLIVIRLLLLILLLRSLYSLLLHLGDAIKEFLQENLNLARFPKIGSKTLQVNLHIMDFVRYGEILVEIQKPYHCTERLLELGSFLF
jgi:hypothetical protein